MAIHAALGIRKERIERRKPWQNYVETLFSIQQRMADWDFARATTWAELADAHARWVGNYNEQVHWAHRRRTDGRESPKTVLGWISAQVEAPSSSPALLAELDNCQEAILRLPEPRAVLESPQILATRAAYKALGKDPARYRGSAEALLRRVIAGKGLPRINAVVDIITRIDLVQFWTQIRQRK